MPLQTPSRDGGDPALRATLAAFFQAGLNVAEAASALTLHPNSLCYRLRKFHRLTGRDPRKLSDLLELVTAARLIARDSARELNPK